jgi:hypothetical protein
MSNSNQVKFHHLQIGAYAGLTKETKVDVDYPTDVSDVLKNVDPDGGLVIVFPDGLNYMQKEGEQETGKTSLDLCLAELIGLEVAPNAINSITNEKWAKLRLTGKDGNLYDIRSTKSTFSVERIETDPDTGEIVTNEKGREIKASMGEPKSFIRKVVGPAGVSPEKIKQMSGAEQVAWVRSLFTLSKEVLEQEAIITKEYSASYKARTTAGNNKKFYKNLVDDSPYYKEYEKWEKYFAETNFDDLEQKMAAVREAYTVYQKSEQGIETLKTISLPSAKERVTVEETAILDIEKQIQELQRQLTKKHDDLDVAKKNVIAVEERIANGQTWLDENKRAKDDFESMSTQVEEATNFKSDKVKWETMLENKKQMDHHESEVIRLTNRLDEYAKAKQQIVAMYSPDVEGLEVCTPQEGDDREGLYYHGKTVVQLAESALWEMATKLWKTLGVKVIFVENISSLGSGAIGVFNEFLENGGMIFATMMNRAQKNMKITWHKKIV